MKQQLLLVIACLLHFSQWSACNDLTQGSLSYPNFNYEETLTVFFTAFAMHLGILTNGNLNTFKITISGFGTFFPHLITRSRNAKQKSLVCSHKKAQDLRDVDL